VRVCADFGPETWVQKFMADFDSNQFPTLKIPKHMARLERHPPPLGTNYNF